MPAISYKSFLKIFSIIIFILLSSLFVSAKGNNVKEEARMYRDRGYRAQSIGDFDTAMSYYQKAIELDLGYAAAYNDLGVIYDSKGFKDRAEASYKRCLIIDPYYQSAYSNLANLYEEKGDLKKAAYYWKKRIQIGDPGDPWTQRAKQRLQNIGMLVEDIGKELKQQEAIESLKSTAQEIGELESKTSLETANQKEKKEKAKVFFRNARAKYLKGDYAAAFNDAVTAQYLDPSNSEIDRLVDKVLKKLLRAY